MTDRSSENKMGRYNMSYVRDNSKDSINQLVSDIVNAEIYCKNMDRCVKLNDLESFMNWFHKGLLANAKLTYKWLDNNANRLPKPIADYVKQFDHRSKRSKEDVKDE